MPSESQWRKTRRGHAMAEADSTSGSGDGRPHPPAQTAPPQCAPALARRVRLKGNRSLISILPAQVCPAVYQRYSDDPPNQLPSPQTRLEYSGGGGVSAMVRVLVAGILTCCSALAFAQPDTPSSPTSPRVIRGRQGITLPPPPPVAPD